MKDIYKYKNSLEAQRMGLKLHLDNQLINCMFAMDDVLKKKGRYSLLPIPIDLNKTRSLDLETIKDSGFGACVQVVHIG
jgi:hypothetical protein